MFCTGCGNKVEREDKFCSECGAPIRRQAAESAAAAAFFPADAGQPIARTSSTAEMQLPLTPSRPRTPESAPPPIAEEPPSEPLFALVPPPAPENIPLAPSGEYVISADKGNAAAAAVGPQASTLRFAAQPSYMDTQEKKSRLPVLEIIVIVLLVLGAGAAFWMLHSSLPGKRVAPASTVAVTLSPPTAEVVAGKALDVTAAVTGTEDNEVTWSVQEGDEGGRVVPRGAKAEAGGVASLAVYVAPSTPGTYHLVATSKADPKQSATSEITVVAAKANKQPAKAKHKARGTK